MTGNVNTLAAASAGRVDALFIQRERRQVTVKLCVLVHWLVILLAANDTYNNGLPTIINIVDIKCITKQQHVIHV